MSGFIAFAVFTGLAAFIVFLYVRRKRVEGEMSDFYKQYSLSQSKEEPLLVRENLGANDNLYCCRANLTTKTGAHVEFYWWEWYLKSNTVINGVPAASFADFLAVSFAPDAVTADFAQKAFRFAEASGESLAQKVKDFFIINVEKPYRAEKLADGSLIICWRVLKRREVYEAKIEWLKNNLSAPVKSETIAPETTQNAELLKLETAGSIIASRSNEAAARNEPEIMRVDFYRHDSYAALKRRLKSGWTNLGLELNHKSAKFQHEGWDIMESDATFGDSEKPNDIVFTLDDKTFAAEATRLFSEFSGGTAYITREQYPVETTETLAYCNNPFRLPLDEFIYAEFKQRFSTRWANLSIVICPIGELNIRAELDDSFDMKTLKNAAKAFLHDYIYISDWMNSLVYLRLVGSIRNEKFGIGCEGNLRNLKFKEFNEATSAESLRQMSIR